MQHLYREASLQGYGCHTKQSAISGDYVCEAMRHEQTGTGEDGIPIYTSHGAGAMYGDTPMIAEVRALSAVGVRFDWSLIADELAVEIVSLLPRHVVWRELEYAIGDLTETIHGS